MRYGKESKGTVCSFVKSVNIDFLLTHCRLCAGAGATQGKMLTDEAATVLMETPYGSPAL